MYAFATFQSVITPYIIVLVYWMGVVLLPLLVIASSKRLRIDLSTWQSKATLLFVILFIELFWRMMNEFMIVYFKIYQAVQ